MFEEQIKAWKKARPRSDVALIERIERELFEPFIEWTAKARDEQAYQRYVDRNYEPDATYPSFQPYALFHLGRARMRNLVEASILWNEMKWVERRHYYTGNKSIVDAETLFIAIEDSEVNSGDSEQFLARYYPLMPRGDALDALEEQRYADNQLTVQ